MTDETGEAATPPKKGYPVWLMGAGIGIGLAIGNGVTRSSGSRWIGTAAGAAGAAVFALALVGVVILWRRRKARR